MDRYSAVTEYRFDWRTEREPSWEDIVFWRETGTKDEVVDEVDAREGACSIETAMSGGCRHGWVSVWDLGAKGASARWAVARVAGRGRTRKSALRYVCDCLVARGGARGECCGGEARPARLLLPRRERGREDLRLSRSWCDRCQRRRASGVGVPGRGCEGLCRRWESAKVVVVGGVGWCGAVWCGERRAGVGYQ